MAERKPDRVYSPSEKSTLHPNEITDLMESVGRVPKLMAMWLTKLLRRPTLPGKVKITGKRVRYCLELLTLRAVVSPTGRYATKGFSPFRSVVSGGRNHCS